MLAVETIRKVRLALGKGERQRSVTKKYRMSHKIVKKVADGNETEYKYTGKR
jgi:hypothetical protein